MIDVLSLKDEYSPVVVRKTKMQEVKTDAHKSKHLFNLKIPAITAALLTPTTVFAAETGDTFIKIYDAVMKIVDHGVVLIIIFAGASWMLGHRSKGIELLISAAMGYIIVMHAVEIRDFLKELSTP